MSQNLPFGDRLTRFGSGDRKGNYHAMIVFPNLCTSPAM